MCFLAFIQIIIVLTRISFEEYIGMKIVNILLLLYVFLAMAFTGVLSGFHTFLSVKNTTTNEFCKDAWVTISGNPFSKYLSDIF